MYRVFVLLLLGIPGFFVLYFIDLSNFRFLFDYQKIDIFAYSWVVYSFPLQLFFFLIGVVGSVYYILSPLFSQFSEYVSAYNIYTILKRGNWKRWLDYIYAEYDTAHYRRTSKLLMYGIVIVFWSWLVYAYFYSIVNYFTYTDWSINIYKTDYKFARSNSSYSFEKWEIRKIQFKVKESRSWDVSTDIVVETIYGESVNLSFEVVANPTSEWYIRLVSDAKDNWVDIEDQWSPYISYWWKIYHETSDYGVIANDIYRSLYLDLR